jgi:hypothetical protein
LLPPTDFGGRRAVGNRTAGMGSGHRCGDAGGSRTLGGVINQEDAMYHPVVTAELARQHRRDLLQQAERRRAAKRRDIDRVPPSRKPA